MNPLRFKQVILKCTGYAFVSIDTENILKETYTQKRD